MTAVSTAVLEVTREGGRGTKARWVGRLACGCVFVRVMHGSKKPVRLRCFICQPVKKPKR